MTLRTTARLAVLASALGVLLHLYTAAFKASGGISFFLLGLLSWSCVPYVITALLARRPNASLLSLGAACLCLVVDGYMHYSVFVAPKSSTAAVGLLFAPLWNLLLVGPLGAAGFWLAGRAFARTQNAP